MPPSAIFFNSAYLSSRTSLSVEVFRLIGSVSFWSDPMSLRAPLLSNSILLYISFCCFYSGVGSRTFGFGAGSGAYAFLRASGLIELTPEPSSISPISMSLESFLSLAVCGGYFDSCFIEAMAWWVFFWVSFYKGFLFFVGSSDLLFSSDSPFLKASYYFIDPGPTSF